MNILLCGFMGCGKTTVGEILAQKLQFECKDMDALIEAEQGRKITEIFAAEGEPYFRDLEHEKLLDLLRKQDQVLSSGGGCMTFQRNIDAARKNAFVVFLDVPLEILKTRLQGDTTRPLLQSSGVKALFEKRLPVYKAAAHLIADGQGTPEQIAEQIAEQLAKRV